MLTGLFETSAVLLFFVLTARATGHARLGVLAAAIYELSAGGLMTTWFAFHTQVAAQWAQLALMALRAVTWPRWDRRFTWWGIVLLLILAALGHIGTFINLVIWGALVVPLLWWRFAGVQERRATMRLFQAGLLAGLFVALFYYSMDARLFAFAAQLPGSDLNELTGCNPIPRETSLYVLWQGGLIEHFGFFPMALAGAGLWLLLRSPQGRLSALPWMLLATLISSISQGILPFLTLSSLTTRWLMFASWAIAVAAAPVLLWLWQRGRAGRMVSLGMAGYVCWNTLLILIDAMALRQPPIEPF